MYCSLSFKKPKNEGLFLVKEISAKSSTLEINSLSSLSEVNATAL